MKKRKFGTIGKVVLVLLFISLMTGVGVYQIKIYEKSALSLYAGQQDAYVQLVLDQINLQEDRTDEDIVTDILASLDTSNHKYWTLSKEQALLFVKNVAETNQYKGFTTATFYVTESAQHFLDSLTLNRVVDETIVIGEDTYVASGVIFEYNGSRYRICLLTDQDIILENNSFLSSKISMTIYVIVLLLLLLLSTMLFIYLIEKKSGKITQLEEQLNKRNKEVETLQISITNMDQFHSRWNLYHNDQLKVFLSKLQKRKVHPVQMIQLHFPNRNQRDEFLQKAQLLLDEKVLRFENGPQDLVLLFVQYTPQEAEKALGRLQETQFIIQNQK